MKGAGRSWTVAELSLLAFGAAAITFLLFIAWVTQ